jgi:hypothetical protein
MVDDETVTADAARTELIRAVFNFCELDWWDDDEVVDEADERGRMAIGFTILPNAC